MACWFIRAQFEMREFRRIIFFKTKLTSTTYKFSKQITVSNTTDHHEERFPFRAVQCAHSEHINQQFVHRYPCCILSKVVHVGKESPTYNCEGSSGGTETTLWAVQLRNRDPISGKVKRGFCSLRISM